MQSIYKTIAQNSPQLLIKARGQGLNFKAASQSIWYAYKSDDNGDMQQFQLTETNRTEQVTFSIQGKKVIPINYRGYIINIRAAISQLFGNDKRLSEESSQSYVHISIGTRQLFEHLMATETVGDQLGDVPLGKSAWLVQLASCW